MGRAHSNAYLSVSQFFDLKYQPVLKAVAARDPENTKRFAHKWGYQSHYTDWRQLVNDPEIDVVDIASPNDTMRKFGLQQRKQGKGFFVKNRSREICKRRNRWSTPPKKRECAPWFGTTIAGSPQ